MAGIGQAVGGFRSLAGAARECLEQPRVLTAAAYAYAMLLLSRDLGQTPTPAAALAAFGASALLVWSVVRSWGIQASTPRALLVPLLAVAGTGAVGLVLSRAFGGGIAVLLLLLALSRVSPARDGLGLRPFVMSAVLWIAYTSAVKLSSAAWHAERGLNQLLTKALSAFVLQDCAHGVSVSGFRLLAFFVLFGLSFEVLAQTRRWGRFARHVAVSMATTGAALAVLLLARDMPAYQAGPYHPLLDPNTAQPLTALLLLAVWVWHYASCAVLQASDVVGFRQTAALVLLFAAFGIWFAPAREHRMSPAVGLISERGAANTIYSCPAHGRYGRTGGGMYGLLPLYLADMGFRSAVLERPLTRQKLEPFSVTVLLMPMPFEPFEPTEREAIRQHVARGKSLLIVGDHTGGGSFTAHVNDLLDGTGMQLRSDAGWPRVPHWWWAVDARSHPAGVGVRGIADAAATCTNVGGTLDIHWPAEPLLIGRYGWADRGDPLNVQMGGLGDNHRGPDEPVGDLVLAASSMLGRGKVILFGDSSAFQNGALPQSHAFVRSVLSWACCQTKLAPLRGNTAIAVTALLLGLLMLRRTVVGIGWLAAAGTTVLVLGAICHVARMPVAPQAPQAPAARRAGIDLSHVNLTSLANSSGNACWGLVQTLQREKYLPYVLSRFDWQSVSHLSVLVIPAPLKSLSDADLLLCRRHLGGGGRIVLTVGHEQRHGAQKLLDCLGVSVSEVPLGRLSVAWQGSEVQFYEAWPLHVRDAAGSALLSDGAWPLAAEVRSGKGTALVVGDSFFCLNKNLENQETHYLGNILFLGDWLSQRGPRGGKGR